MSESGRWGGADSDPLLLRAIYRPLSAPLARIMLQCGVRPDTITVAGFAVALLSCAAVAAGNLPWMVVGGVLLQVSSFLDCCDGAVAREGGMTTRRGALLDIVLDRYSDSAFLLGLAVATGEIERFWPWLLAAAFASMLGPYLTALGASKGMVAQRLLRRTDRLLLCSIGAVAGQPAVTLVVIAFVANGDAIRCLMSLLRSADRADRANRG